MAKKGRNRGSFKKGDPRAGRPPGCLNKITLEGRAFARAILGGDSYRHWLEDRIEDHALSPQLEVLLWYYGFGKPKEMVELTGAGGGPLVTEIRRVIVDGQSPTD